MAAGFAHFLDKSETGREIARDVSESAESERPDPYDSHPPLPERIAALEKLADCAEPDDKRPGVDLFQALAELEERLVSFTLGEHARQMQRVTWADAGSRAIVSIWRDVTKSQAGVIAGLQVSDLANLKHRLPELAFRVRPEPGCLPSREERQAEALNVIRAAFGLAMVDAGWKFDYLPGEPVEFYRGNERIGVMELLRQNAEGEIADADWHQRTERMGVAASALG